jgi:hypothetical protein
MLMAPDAPAPIAIQIIAIEAVTGPIEVNPPGAKNIPAAAVKTTNDITLGLSSNA